MEPQTRQQELETATNSAKTYLEYRRWIRNRAGNLELTDSQIGLLLLCGSYRDSQDFRVTSKLVTKVFQRPFSSANVWIKGLVKHGLLEYEPSNHRRGGHSLRLTEAGIEKYNGIVLGFQAKMRDMPIDDNSGKYLI